MQTKSTGNPEAKKKATSKKLRKSRKKTHYHTGVHHSKKCPTPINYRSGWEAVICRYLDADPTVQSYTYESIIITYVSNNKSKRIRKYFPDFLVTYTNGKKKMVEVKRESQLTNLKVQKKAEAAKIWCDQQNPKIQYEFWTDKMILPLQKAEKLREKLLSLQTKPKKKSK